MVVAVKCLAPILISGCLPGREMLFVTTGYALSKYVLTPYSKKRLSTCQRYYYNYMQSKCRRCVEQVCVHSSCLLSYW